MNLLLQRAVPLMLALVLASSAQAEITKEMRDATTSALQGLGEATTPEQVDALTDRLLDPDVSVEEWSAFFANYFQEHIFTPGIATYWQTAVQGAEGEDQEQLALLSGVSAAAAVGRGLSKAPGEGTEDRYAGIVSAVTWLSNLSASLGPEPADRIFEVLRLTLKSSPAALVPVTGRPPAPSPQLAWLGAQLALTVRDYAVLARKNPETVATTLGLLEPGLHFWQAYGILLLDNSGLNPDQLRSLDNLLGVIPRELHAIGAVVVPETTGLDPASTNLVLRSGQIIPIAAIPMDRPTRADEFALTAVHPIAPDFTIAAAQQVVRAIQVVQFRTRPDLVVRRDAILASAGGRQGAYLRQTVSPSVYLNNPDELLPSLACLWFINTPATLQTAEILFDLGLNEAFDEFLLLADLLSGGGNQTLVFVTDPSGAVNRDTSLVARTYLTPTSWLDMSGGPATPIPAGTLYLTGIVMNGMRWNFDIGLGGIVSRYSNAPAG